MAVYDICTSSGMDQLVSAFQMHTAVNIYGFNPFKLGLASSGANAILGISEEMAFDHWKYNIVAPDSTDWNIFRSCMQHLNNYL